MGIWKEAARNLPTIPFVFIRVHWWLAFPAIP
jgi:hypothetical protein